jgi:Flp pilus assembly protein TadD
MLRTRKIASCAVLILLLSCVLAHAGEDPVGKVAAALRNREFDKALELLEGALQNSPGNAQLWTMQGVAFAGRGQNSQALT